MKRLILPLALVGLACDSGPSGPAPTYTVGGQASGVIGSGCVLQVNGANNLTITGNGPFTFPATFLDGENYVARVSTHPIGPDQTCSLTDSSGTVNDANVTNIGVACTVDRPACATNYFAGTMAGDVGTPILTDSWHGEAWTRVQLTEDNSSPGGVYLSATVTLTVPAGVDYDLYLYCASCGTAPVASSVNGTGMTEAVYVRWEDDFGEDDDGTFYVQVRYFNGSSPNNWNMQIAGNTVVSTTNCDF
jgi:hypothetical protein